MTARNKESAEKNLPETKLIITNAEGKAAKQISDVESLEFEGMKVLMISAHLWRPVESTECLASWIDLTGSLRRSLRLADRR